MLHCDCLNRFLFQLMVNQTDLTELSNEFKIFGIKYSRLKRCTYSAERCHLLELNKLFFYNILPVGRPNYKL